MSLLQELNSFPNFLNQKYNRTDFDEILDKYCDRVAKLPQEEIAKYVVQADKERFETQKDDFGKPTNYVLNSGHVYTGIMCEPKLLDKFTNWFEETYILDSDLSKKESIADTIRHHLDSRCEGMVISHLLDKGLMVMKDKETIQNALFEIDERNDKAIVKNYEAKQKGENIRSFNILGREFEKALQKTCYIIANQHESWELAEYISDKLDISYGNEATAEIILEDYKSPENTKKMTIKDANHKRLAELLTSALQNVAYKNINEHGLNSTIDLFDDILDNDKLIAGHWETKNINNNNTEDDIFVSQDETAIFTKSNNNNGKEM